MRVMKVGKKYHFMFMHDPNMSIEKNILHGPKPVVPLSNDTAGQQLYAALLKHSHLPEAMIDAHTHEVLSYRTILETTCLLAQSLQKYGLTQNSVISVCSENNLYFLYPVIAALYLGVITAPLNENYMENELFNAVNISKPDLIFCSTKSLPKILKLKEIFPFIQKVIILDSKYNINNVECLQNFIAHYSDKNLDLQTFKPLSFDSSKQVALIIGSSGTTGLPKGVMVTHKNIAVRFSHCRDPIFGTQTKPKTTVLTFLPFFHASGMLLTLGYFIVGVRTVMLRRFELELFLTSIEEYKVQGMFVVPPVMVLLAKSLLVHKYKLSSLKELACAAAPLGRKVAEATIKRLNIKGIRQGYGLTESTLAVLFTPDDEFRAGSSGKVVPLMSAKVIDIKSGNTLDCNQTGELCFKGPMVMKGYAGNLKATQEAIDADGWLHTGDIGYYDQEGHFYIVDRLKELIKYKGFQVPPAELEALLLQHPSIKDAAVVGVPDEVAGELPAAFVVKQPGKELTEQEVYDFVADRISSPKHLRGGIRFIDEVPKNATGKIIRKELRRLVQKHKSKL